MRASDVPGSSSAKLKVPKKRRKRVISRSPEPGETTTIIDGMVVTINISPAETKRNSHSPDRKKQSSLMELLDVNDFRDNEIYVEIDSDSDSTQAFLTQNSLKHPTKKKKKVMRENLMRIAPMMFLMIPNLHYLNNIIPNFLYHH
jgi:hypothetical protein